MTMQNPEVFEGKSFQALLKDIYDNSNAKKIQIKTLMDALANMLQQPNSTPTDVAIIAPLVKDFLEVAVKNDDHLVKIAAIMQRLISAETSAVAAGGEFLTDNERAELLKEAEEEMLEEMQIVIEEDEEVSNLKKKSDSVVRKLEKNK